MRLIREPLLWFLVLGTGLFFVWRTLAPEPRDTILITHEAIEAVVQQQEALTGKPVTSAGREELVQGYIDDEVLLREAYRRGYHQTDYRTRKRLLSVMRSTLTPSLPEPSRAQLEAYYRENADKFEVGEVATYDQVLFTASSALMPEDPGTVREALMGGAEFTAMGDRGMAFPSATLRDQSRNRIVVDFGPAVYEKVATLPYGDWSEGIPSRGGIVFVRVHERRTEATPDFDSIEAYVGQDYRFTMTRAGQAEKTSELRALYEIIFESNESP